MSEELIFHMAGDDHEERVYFAADEAEARELCAADFNEQYDASYRGDEFDLLGVYRNPLNIDVDEDNFEEVLDSLERLGPEKEYVVTLVIAQTITAADPVEAERIARVAVDKPGSPLWWPSLVDEPARVEEL